MKKYPPRTHKKEKIIHFESYRAAYRSIARMTSISTFRHTPMPLPPLPAAQRYQKMAAFSPRTPSLEPSIALPPLTTA